MVALSGSRPFPLDRVREALEDEGAAVQEGATPERLTVRSEDATVDVRFEPGRVTDRWPPELLTGTADARDAVRAARGAYHVEWEAGGNPPVRAVFEALWVARRILELGEGVLLDVPALKLHGAEDVSDITELDFDIRDHLSLHAVEAAEGDTPLWVHTHGMAKFGARDVEIFHLGEDDLPAAESFLNEICGELAFGQGPPPRAQVGTSEGAQFSLVPSEEARANLLGVELDTFEGHEGQFLTVVSPLGRHNTAELLRPYRQRFHAEPEERTEGLLEEARALLPAFKARFLRRGLMEPLSFSVRAAFEIHPQGLDAPPDTENLWAEVVAWEEGTLVGKVVEGSSRTTEWRKGAHVEIPEDEINALSLQRGGQTLDEDDMRALLVAERPA